VLLFSINSHSYIPLAVTHAALSNWEYMETIRQAADPKCSKHLENAIETIDRLLGTPLRWPLKASFGLASLESDEDFVAVLQVGSLHDYLFPPYVINQVQSPLGSWQEKNWDPDVGSVEFDEFCNDLAKPPYGFIGDPSSLDKLAYGEDQRNVYLSADVAIDFTVLNYAKYIKKVVISFTCLVASV
jgi:hypothetical protein